MRFEVPAFCFVMLNAYRILRLLRKMTFVGHKLVVREERRFQAGVSSYCESPRGFKTSGQYRISYRHLRALRFNDVVRQMALSGDSRDRSNPNQRVVDVS